MRRLIAVVVLVSGGWTQLASFDCPMIGSGAGMHASAPDGSAAGHGDHRVGAAHADGSTASDHTWGSMSGSTSGPASDSGCRTVMACGTAVLATPATSAPSSIAVTKVVVARLAPRTYTAVFPAHEPPPPRLTV